MNIFTSLNVFKSVIINIDAFALFCFHLLIIIHCRIPEHPGWTISRCTRGAVVQNRRAAGLDVLLLINTLESVFIPHLEVTHQLALRIINRLLLEVCLRFQVFEFVVAITVLALQVFKLLKLA